jgi:hypothetical protein
LPDLLWMVLARFGVEPAQHTNFFDDWSHSLLSVVVLASLFAIGFRRCGRAVVLGIWLAVFSHFALDFPVHPKKLALDPLSRIHLGWDLLAWGSRPGWFGAINDWWLQLFVLLILLFVYVRGTRTWRIPANLSLASCTLLVGLQVLTLFSCISY